jgi:ankyrin repeat protein
VLGPEDRKVGLSFHQHSNEEGDGVASSIGLQLFEACSCCTRPTDSTISRIREIVESYPSVITSRDVDGRIALHVACASKVNIRVVEYLVQKWADSIYQVTNKGWTPLHYACRFQATPDIVDYLIRRWSDSIIETTQSGWLPLHLACACQAPEDVSDLLLHAWPESVWRKTTTHGRLPIHYALANFAPFSLIQGLVEGNPQTIQVKDMNGWTPFHVACAYNRLEVVQYCIQHWRVGCKERGSKGRIPLHVVCWEKRPIKLVQYIREQWDDSIRVKDNDGYLPLHAACESGAPIEVIMYLIDQWPASMWELGKSKEDIIDYAFRKQTIEESRVVVDFSLWIEATIARMTLSPSSLSSPESSSLLKSQFLGLPSPTREHISSCTMAGASERNRGSSSEFHASNSSLQFEGNGPPSREHGRDEVWHTAHKASSERPDELDGQHSDMHTTARHRNIAACRVGDDGLNLMGAALQKACEAPQSLHVIQTLLSDCPLAIEFLGYDGNLPIHTACLNQAPLEIVKVLVDHHPSSLQKRDNNGNLPLHHACFSGSPLRSIKHLLQRYPDSISQTNRLGESPLDRARKPFFDTQDHEVVEWLQNPYFNEVDDDRYNESAAGHGSALPSSAPIFNAVSSGTNVASFQQLSVDIGKGSVDSRGSLTNMGINTNTGQYKGPVSSSVASNNDMRRKQPAILSFSKPLGVDETRAVLERLRASKVESRRASMKKDTDGIEKAPAEGTAPTERNVESNIFSQHHPTAHERTEAINQQLIHSIPMGVDKVRAKLTLLRSNNEMSHRNLKSTPAIGIADDDVDTMYINETEVPDDYVTNLKDDNDCYEELGFRTLKQKSSRKRYNTKVTPNFKSTHGQDQEDDGDYVLPRSVSAIYKSALQEELEDSRSSLLQFGDHSAPERIINDHPEVPLVSEKGSNQLMKNQVPPTTSPTDHHTRWSWPSSTGSSPGSRSASDTDTYLGIIPNYESSTSKHGMVQRNSAMYQSAYTNTGTTPQDGPPVDRRPSESAFYQAALEASLLSPNIGLDRPTKTSPYYNKAALESEVVLPDILSPSQPPRPGPMKARARSLDDDRSLLSSSSPPSASPLMHSRMYGEPARTSLLSATSESSGTSSHLEPRPHSGSCGSSIVRGTSSSSGSARASTGSLFLERNVNDYYFTWSANTTKRSSASASIVGGSKPTPHNSAATNDSMMTISSADINYSCTRSRNGILPEELTQRSSITRAPLAHPCLHPSAGSSSVSSSIGHTTAGAMYDNGQREEKRPGIVMVNEPAIHPNSVLYRAAYRTTPSTISAQQHHQHPHQQSWQR